MQLDDLFSGTCRTNVQVPEVTTVVVQAKLKDGGNADLGEDVVTTMISLLPHFMKDTFAIKQNYEIAVDVADTSQDKIAAVGNPVSVQILETLKQSNGPLIVLKQGGIETQAQVGLDRHNLLRNNHVDTPLMFHDELLCRDARIYAEKLAQGNGAIKHDFSELVRLGQGENLFRLEVGQGKISSSVRLYSSLD